MVCDSPDLIPTRAHPWDAGADVRAAHDAKIRPHCAELIKTGVKISIPHGCVGYLVSRSGHGKQRVSLANRLGIIDSGYTGELMVRLENLGDTEFLIERGDRVAQLIISPVIIPTFIQVETLEETARGESGFGSTGVK